MKINEKIEPVSSFAKSHDATLDHIRLIAFVLLIACHACDSFNAAATYGSGDANPEFTWWGAVWGSMVRPCVPFLWLISAFAAVWPISAIVVLVSI